MREYYRYSDTTDKACESPEYAFLTAENTNDTLPDYWKYATNEPLEMFTDREKAYEAMERGEYIPSLEELELRDHCKDMEQSAKVIEEYHHLKALQPPDWVLHVNRIEELLKVKS
jgi:hypothetical protein